MVACKPHAHRLRGLSFGGARAEPLVVQRTDQEFIAALLAELGRADGRAGLPSFAASTRDANGTLRLFQPVHRTFHVVLVEAFCEEVGFPRVDPARIESAGLVVRRVEPAPKEGGKAVPAVPTGGSADARTLGWMRRGDAIVGWMPLDERQRERDPDPERRLPEARAGHREIDRLLAARAAADDGLAETVHPLFVAPPEVCRAAGRTILYALVPITSTESSESAKAPPEYAAEDAARVVPPFLRESSLITQGQRTAHQWSPTQEESGETRTWVESLDGLGVFGDTPEAVELMKTLNAVSAQYYVYGQPATVLSSVPLGNELRKAAERLTDLSKPVRSTTNWMRWTLDDKQAGAIAAGFRKLLSARLGAITPGEARYDLGGALYRVRAFVRLTRPCGCPPELVWTVPGERFTIVPWYESGAAPPVRVNLPEATPAALRKLKPNVTFATPASVADLLNGIKLKDLSEGKKPGGGGLGMDLMCGFSIPIITLCAFIVLSIFLSLLNIIFWWLPLVKICIPVPKKG